MAPIPESTFADRLRELPTEQVVEFVADLWAARGYETRIEGQQVIATRDGDRRRLAIDHGTSVWKRTAIRALGGRPRSSQPPDSVDVVVTTASQRRVRRLSARLEQEVIGIPTLRELLLYAISPPQADRLCWAYFDRPAREQVVGGDASWVATRNGRLALLGVIGLTILMIAGGVVGTPTTAGWLGLEPPVSTATPRSQQAGQSPTGTPTPLPTGITPAPETEVFTVRSSRGTPSLPAGLSERGLSDPEALIDGHIEELAGRSYTWTITYRVISANVLIRGEQLLKRQEVIRVRRPSRYVTNVSGDRIRIGQTNPTANVSAYATDGYRYVKSSGPNGTSYRRTPLTYRLDRTRYAVRARVLLAKYLWNNQSTTLRRDRRDGEPVYVVRLIETGNESQPTTTTMVIGPDGVIRTLQRKSTIGQHDDVTVIISFDYTAIG
ncbi:MAG: hypothetical protein ABEI76_07825, partial [Halobacteriales archaeon]